MPTLKMGLRIHRPCADNSLRERHLTIKHSEIVVGHYEHHVAR